jgi:hypothetical protein
MQVISRYECTILRGIAILGIILHNFCHKIPGAVEGNEFNFDITCPIQLFHEICNPNIGLLNHLLSFFGHYGVALFVFLSGYGLSVKYENACAKQPSFRGFMLHNLTKFWKYYIPGVIIYLAIYIPLKRWLPIHLPMLCVQSMFVANLIPNGGVVPYIYWYFGMAMQLYVVFWLLVRNRSVGVLFAISAVQLLAQYFAFMFLEGDQQMDIMEYFSINCLSWLMPFAAGVYVARYGYPSLMRKYRKTVICGLVALFVAGQFINYFWPFAAVCMVGFCVIIASRVSSNFIGKFLNWVGVLSAIIFVAQPTTREIFLLLNPNLASYGIVLAFAVATIVVAWLTRKIVARIDFTWLNSIIAKLENY